MNLKAPEALQIYNQFKEQIGGADVEGLIQKIPNLGNFAQLAQKLLPQNLVSADENGNISLLSNKNVQDLLASGAENVKDLVVGEVNNVLQSAMGTIKATVNDVVDTVKSLGSQVLALKDQITDTAVEGYQSLVNMNFDVNNISNLLDSAYSITNKVSELSPKGIKGLSDAQNYISTLNSLTDSALGTIKSTSLDGATALAFDAVQSSGVSNLFATVSQKISDNSGSSYDVPVEIVPIWEKGVGAVVNLNTVTGKKYTPKKTCAVDGKNILIGSKVTIEGIGTLNAIDKIRVNSSATTRTTINVFVKTREEAVKLPSTAVAKVVPPVTNTKYNQPTYKTRGQNVKYV